jgi:hypothetical protein
MDLSEKNINLSENIYVFSEMNGVFSEKNMNLSERNDVFS